MMIKIPQMRRNIVRYADRYTGRWKMGIIDLLILSLNLGTIWSGRLNFQEITLIDYIVSTSLIFLPIYLLSMILISKFQMVLVNKLIAMLISKYLKLIEVLD